MPKNLTPIELHQLLVWKFPKADNVTDACRAAAREYGLSAESMRTYVYNGIGFRSKAYKRVAADVEEMKRYEQSGWRLIAASEKQLVEALEFHAKTMRYVSDQFTAIKKEIEETIKARESA